MEKIGDLLDRARQNRRRRETQPPLQREIQPVPQHQSSHANYSALMRSHDRMQSRHIAGKGGADGA